MIVSNGRVIAGWVALGFWSIALGAVAFSLASALSIGVYVVPFALLLCSLAALRATAWPEAPLGALVGAGSVSLLIGFLHLHYVPCPSGPQWLAPGESFACGGLPPTPWLLVGASLVATGLGGYALCRRRPASSP